MSFDPLKQFLDYKIAYLKLRGGFRSTGKKHYRTGLPLSAPSEVYPATRWGDVMSFYRAFIIATDPTTDECYALLKTKGLDPKFCNFRGENNPADFVHTASFNAARTDWQRVSPIWKAAEEAGKTPGTQAGEIFGMSTALTHVAADQVYPWNEEFWAYGEKYAIARSAAGMVKYPIDIAAESVAEATSEAWKQAKKFLPTLPQLDHLATIIKWGTIGTVALLGWWYVLRPLAARRRRLGH